MSEGTLVPTKTSDSNSPVCNIESIDSPLNDIATGSHNGNSPVEDRTGQYVHNAMVGQPASSHSTS